MMIKKLGVSGSGSALEPEDYKGSSTIKSTGCLKCYYANVDNSLLSKMEEIQALVAESSYDIIALNEVKPKNGVISSLSLLNIQGYELLYSDFSKPDTRGVCIYIKKHLSASQIVPSSVTEFNDVVWVSVSENGCKDKILFGCV